MAASKKLSAPYELVKQTAKLGKLPVPNFAAGGIATPADASIRMQIGAEAMFVVAGRFKSDERPARAKAMVDEKSHVGTQEIRDRVTEGSGRAG